MAIQSETYSVCVRCGKTRILLKTWKEKELNKRGAVIIHEQTVCPDKECQKIVDEKLQQMRDLRAASENRKKDIIIARKAASVKA